MMRTIKFVPLAPLTLLSLLLAACATPPVEHLYHLDYPQTASSQTEPQYEVLIATVKLPEAVHRPQLVIQKSATESLISDEQRWIAPLDEQLTVSLIAHLRTRLPDAWLSSDTGISAGINTGISANPSSTLPRYLVKVQIDQLLIYSGNQLTLEASWVVLDNSRKLLKREHKVFTVRLNSPAYEAVAPAMSEAAQQLAEQVGASVQGVRKPLTGAY
ncbi:PqiC family protein [Undibacterium sp. Di26W]|uniref:PqiC family protein n=1 Tax=Undibacterium sp. Di26W TaxID=3413035 RepID=UPI003BF1D0C8